ncbi:MAG: hypothetical protein GC193_05590 [Cryomorphaceae bacterium]|nr:hypothetical protein [Cryomorphaceae bacterium]
MNITKYFKKYILLLLCFTASALSLEAQNLVLTGVVHGPLAGTPKALELYVIADIPDLSVYGVGTANNGLGSNGEEFSFPGGTALAGEFIYVVNDGASFSSFFGFDADFIDNGLACNFNGNDAIELFENGVVIDTFGLIDVPGDGTAWEYTLGWAHRNNETGPDGSSFQLSNWEISALNLFSGTTQNSQASIPFPIGTYSYLIISGCTDPIADNYNPMANADDGSCSVAGCVYLAANNYDPLATVDDDSCLFGNDCVADLNNDNLVNSGDLLSFLSSFGTTCPQPAPMTYLSPGLGSFVYNAYQPLSLKPVTVHYYIPEGNISQMPIVFVFHGNNRNGSEYRDAWISSADTHQCIVVAPEFSEEYYPGSEQYMEGNIFDSFGNLNPASEWTFSLIEPLFDFVKSDVGNLTSEYEMFGHSAGGQFVHRFILFAATTSVNRAIAANSGWYTVPDPLVDFPYGLQNSPSGTAQMPTFFTRKLIIHLGQADTNPNDPSLNQSAGANAQGAYRYARGLYFFAESQSISSLNSMPFEWLKIEVPGVAHDFEAMSIDAASILFD